MMAQNTVESVIRKAVTDVEFRVLLLNNPTEALASFDLTDAERSSLSKLDQALFNGTPEELEERLSRGWGYSGSTVQLN